MKQLIYTVALWGVGMTDEASNQPIREVFMTLDAAKKWVFANVLPSAVIVEPVAATDNNTSYWVISAERFPERFPEVCITEHEVDTADQRRAAFIDAIDEPGDMARELFETCKSIPTSGEILGPVDAARRPGWKEQCNKVIEDHLSDPAEQPCAPEELNSYDKGSFVIGAPGQPKAQCFHSPERKAWDADCKLIIERYLSYAGPFVARVVQDVVDELTAIRWRDPNAPTIGPVDATGMPVEVKGTPDNE